MAHIGKNKHNNVDVRPDGGKLIHIYNYIIKCA